MIDIFAAITEAQRQERYRTVELCVQLIRERANRDGIRGTVDPEQVVADIRRNLLHGGVAHDNAA